MSVPSGPSRCLRKPHTQALLAQGVGVVAGSTDLRHLRRHLTTLPMFLHLLPRCETPARTGPAAEPTATVDRMLGLGARHLDIGQGDVPWVVLADPAGNPFCVMEERSAYVDTGPVARSISPPPTRTATGNSGPG